jgi:hypothetical protein
MKEKNDVKANGANEADDLLIAQAASGGLGLAKTKGDSA